MHANFFPPRSSLTFGAHAEQLRGQLAWIERRSLEVVDSKDLFESLDGRRLMLANGPWDIEIYSISDQTGWRWIQLRVQGESAHTLTLKVRSDETADEVKERLARWLVCPDEEGAILNIA